MYSTSFESSYDVHTYHCNRKKRKFLNGKRQRKTKRERDFPDVLFFHCRRRPFSNLQFFDGIILDGETWKEKLSSAASFSSSGSFQLILLLLTHSRPDPKKCKETSNLMWLSLIWFIFVCLLKPILYNSKPQNQMCDWNQKCFCFVQKS